MFLRPAVFRGLLFFKHRKQNLSKPFTQNPLYPFLFFLFFFLLLSLLFFPSRKPPPSSAFAAHARTAGERQLRRPAGGGHAGGRPRARGPATPLLAPPEPSRPLALPHTGESKLAGGGTATARGDWPRRRLPAPPNRPTSTTESQEARYNPQLRPGTAGAPCSTATPPAKLGRGGARPFRPLGPRSQRSYTFYAPRRSS